MLSLSLSLSLSLQSPSPLLSSPSSLLLASAETISFFLTRLLDTIRDTHDDLRFSLRKAQVNIHDSMKELTRVCNTLIHILVPVGHIPRVDDCLEFWYSKNKYILYQSI